MKPIDNKDAFQRFKAPLIAIIGMADLIKQTELNEEQTSFVKTIEDIATSLLVDVNELAGYESAPGAGATPGAVATQPEIDDIAGPTKKALPSNLKVLVVEDNPVMQLAIMKQLQHLGIKAESVMDGAAAKQKLEEKHFDMIFMDCQLPILDGFDATRAIRRIEDQRGTKSKIVALTAGYEPRVRDKCLASGMDECLIKPARIEDLRKTIERCMSPS